MRIREKILSITIIILVILALLLGFGWVNTLVSYKYEVQDSQYAGKVLDGHQKEIINAIASSKIEFICCVILLVLVLIIRVFEPTFKGRIYYVE
jgi:formate hydrogenlyase subunit 3/multisubunit Na+/H+ antiporter MnhD subunit